MRLIDANKVLEHISESQKRRFGMMPIKGIIDKQPTVFDIEARKEFLDAINTQLEKYNAPSALQISIFQIVGRYFGR